LSALAPGQSPRHGAQAGAPEKIFWLGLCGPEAAGVGALSITAPVTEISGLRAQLRATIGGLPITTEARATPAIAEIAQALKAAHFGVVVWSAPQPAPDTLAIEMLQGIVGDLNASNALHRRANWRARWRSWRHADGRLDDRLSATHGFWSGLS